MEVEVNKIFEKVLDRLAQCEDEDYVWMGLDSHDWVTLLTKYQEFGEVSKRIEQKCDDVDGWRKIGSSGLVTLLSHRFDLVNKPFLPLAWENIPKYAKTTKDVVGRTDGKWLRLLEKHPELTTYFDKYNSWKTFDGNDWLSLLLEQPHLSDKCDQYNGWVKFTSWGWACLLKQRPEFASYCDKCKGWSAFTIEDWLFLLSNQPQFIDKADLCSAWSNLPISQWVSILKNQPSLSKTQEAEKRWKDFSGSNWIELLRKDPVWEAECQKRGGWDKIAGCNGWFELLMARPKVFIKQCDRYNGWARLNTHQWAVLLKDHFLLSGRCKAANGFKTFTGYDWVELLREQPLFMTKCQEWGGWAKISECKCWCELLEVCPQFANRCDECTGWNTFDGFDWWRLIKKQTFFVEKCNEFDGWRKIYSCAFDEHCKQGAVCSSIAVFDWVFNRRHFAFGDSNPLLGICGKDVNLLKRVNASYWIYAIETDYVNINCNYASPARMAQDTFNHLSSWGIWWKFNRDDWEQLVCAYNGDVLNSIAKFVDESFWSALHKCWPTWFNDAQDENKARLWPIWDDYSQKVEVVRCYMSCFSAWSHLLIYHPEYACDCKYQNGWRSLEADDWKRLINSGFLDKVDHNVLDGGFWFALLSKAPQFGKTCDEYTGWATLEPDKWLKMLVDHSSFADRCHIWSQFDGTQWVELLKQDASFSGVCDQSDGWSKLGEKDWLSLLLSNKTFANKCEEAGALAKFGWTSVDEAISNYKEKKHHQCDYQDDPLDSPDWREESGWNDMYGDADASDFIEFR